MTVQIKINGPIISSDEKWYYDWFDREATCAKDVSDALPTNGEDLELTINSWGGYVDQGSEIYTMLKSYSGRVVVNVISAYSAASIIAMAGDVVRMSPVGRMMIHNASAEQHGDYHDMDQMSGILQTANNAVSNAYMQKTGKSKEEILKLMDTETWITADEAVEMGFADEIMFESNEQPRLVASAGDMIPHDVLEKIKPLITKEKNAVETGMVEVSGIPTYETFVEQLKNEFDLKPKQVQNHAPEKTQKSLIARLRKGE